MKTLLNLFLFIIIITDLHSQNLSQFDFNLVDIKTKKEVNFKNIFNDYGINKKLPTLIITWSNEWCNRSCTDLINRYTSCDTSKFNLVLVNIDLVKEDTGYSYHPSEEKLFKVLRESQNKWKNAKCFYGQSENGGFEKIVTFKHTPNLLFLDNDLNILYNKANSNGFPYSLFYDLFYEKKGFNNYISYIKNSPEDIIDLILSFLTIEQNIQTYSDFKDDLLYCITALKQNIYNQNYFNPPYGEKDPDLRTVKVYYALSYCYNKLKDYEQSRSALQTALNTLNEKKNIMEDYSYHTYYDDIELKIKTLEKEIRK